MIHLRTPLGVTYDRATKAMDYIARDLRKGLKRPYEDLLCDETMADEDEMEDDSERFLLNGDETKSKEVPIPKLFAAENGNAKRGAVATAPVPIKNIGIVTVVRPHSGKYNSTPNCFTIYGEVSDLNVKESASEKAEKQKENALAINVSENLSKLVDRNISLSPTVNTTATSEINTINNKLTFLDHAYALPPPKGKASSSPRTMTKSVKQPVPKEAKVLSTVKQEQQKKTAGDGQSTPPERTCGIVCFQCDKLVTKSYSCYKKENAPEKIKHLFTPGVKVVKVCRRCMPYKKPKDSEDAAGTGKGKAKIIKGKLAKLHSAKLIKNAKSAGKVNAAKTTEKTKVASLEKNIVKLPTKDEKKRKDSPKDEKLKLLPASKKLCSLAVQTKKAPVLKGTVTKESKAVPKGIRPPIREELKVEVTKSIIPKGANIVSGKTLTTSPKSGAQMQKNDGSAAEKAKSSAIEKENAAVSKDKSVKVDFGTQSMKSMIGINKVKPKTTDLSSPNETVTKDENVAEKEVTEKESTEKEVDVMDMSEKQETETEVAPVESKLSEKVSGTEKEKETVVTTDLETSAKEKIDEEMNTKTGDAVSTEKDKTSNVPEENQSETKKLKDNKMESKNTEEPDVTKQDKAEAIDSKNIADSIITRGRRSASRSPVIARETKSTEALSPRKGRSSGTPETKREDKQIIPTIMTRKRLASFSDPEADKKVDNSAGGKRRALAAALLEKMSRKAGDSSSSTSDVASNKLRVEHPYAKDEKEPEKEVKGHCMTRRNQMPVKCAGCNEKVVKSYRCVMRGDAPVHIKPLFAQQSGEMLRICRKCVKKKETGNAKANIK